MDDSRQPVETNDIVLDILKRIQAIFIIEQALTEAHFQQIEREVKRDWNGERPYIGKKLLSDDYLSARRREIIRMARGGESFAFIGRRFGISRVRAYQIYKGD
jgi:DNA-directed RNA polymerase sigma subunit (sigma70/sigma32)